MGALFLVFLLFIGYQKIDWKKKETAEAKIEETVSAEEKKWQNWFDHPESFNEPVDSEVLSAFQNYPYIKDNPKYRLVMHLFMNTPHPYFKDRQSRINTLKDNDWDDTLYINTLMSNHEFKTSLLDSLKKEAAERNNN